MIETVAAIASGWIDFLSRQSICVGFVFVSILVVTRVLRRLGPAVHLVLWSLVFVRLLLPPALSHPWSAGRVLQRVLPQRTVPASLVTVEFDGSPMGIELGAEFLALGQRNSAVPISLAVLWLTGAGWAMLVYRRRKAPFAAHLRDAAPVSDIAVHELTAQWRRRLGVRRSVQVLSSSARVTPFTVGVVRPIIVVPESIIGDRRVCESVIAHEMAHIARLDALWLELQQLLQAVYFFHPMVWIASSRIDTERERLCDATVISSGDIPARSYAHDLLGLARLETLGPTIPTMTARKRRIDMRIRHILANNGLRKPRLVIAVAGATIIGVVLLPLGSGTAGADSFGKGGSSEASERIVQGTDDIEFENPLDGGRVTSRWGTVLDPWTRDEVFHHGIDVASAAGTAVLAAASGVVVVATEDFQESPSSGTVVVIDHGGGWSTFYSHLGSLEVAPEDSVIAGGVIATVGSTGKSTGPHLHFEVRHGDERLNPADFVSDWK